MRITQAWAKIAAQNVSLKITSALLTLVCGVLCATAIHLSTQDPLIIDRACESKVISAGSTTRSPQETAAFIKEALFARFDSLAPDQSDLLPASELMSRVEEQKILQQKNMRQRVWLLSHKVDGNRVSVECDRMIHAGAVRAYFPLSFEAMLLPVARTASNPYGLILSSLRITEKEEKK